MILEIKIIRSTAGDLPLYLQYTYDGFKPELLETSERRMIIIDGTVHEWLRETCGMELGAGAANHNLRSVMVRDWGFYQPMEGAVLKMPVPDWLAADSC